ncbi:phosphoglycerate mutase-like protein [Auricularia subglabra TFB-10046 SS5]|nr:phosphoglycerate mutase-like protein [Auricularia subglabra TFB-10046 SS5]
MSVPEQRKFTYSLVKGAFAQDDDGFLPTADQVQPRLGLIADKWPDVALLNANAPPGTSYKLVIAGRHGQGYHNVAISKYSREDWQNKWALLNGDTEITWGPDPLLTPLGIEQAEAAHAAWKQYEPPKPGTFYCSPHRRALRTCAITFPGQKVKVLEDIREKLSGHTCDFRLPISSIRDEFPDFDLSAIEHDEDPVMGKTETEEQTADRVRRVLDYLFENEPAHVVSLTAHAGWIRGLMDATGRYRYQLQTGGISPFLVKAEHTA